MITIESVTAGIEKFKKLNGHYPSVKEFNATSYLPNARTIQRKFGGLHNIVPNKKRSSLNSVQDLRPLLERFSKDYNRYPTANDFDTCPYLPSSRLIQRRFGGMIEMRKSLSLPITDYSEGIERSKEAKIINKRAESEQNKIFKLLIKKFSRELVHREYLLSDNSRRRCDFYVFAKQNNFYLDIFYPKDMHSLMGCVSEKAGRYRDITSGGKKVIFLQTNPDINFFEHGDMGFGKYEVMSLPHFKKFLDML